MYGYIYKTTNLINGKIYVGLHRKSEFDNNYLGSGKYLKRAISKYGKESFTCEVIEWCETPDELSEREIYWIDKLNCLDSEVGYNLHEGGGQPPVFIGEEHYLYGKELPQYIKDSISKANNGRVGWNKGLTSEIDNRVLSGEQHGRYGVSSKAWNKGLTSEDDERILAGENHPQFGKPLSEERKEKIRQHHIDYYSIKKNTPHYNKALSEEHKNKISETRIKRGLAKGENNPLYGKNFTKEHREKISDALKGKRTGKENHESKPVLALLLDGSEMIFESITSASNHFNINYSTLSSGLIESLDSSGFYTNTKTGIKFKRLNKEKEVA